VKTGQPLLKVLICDDDPADRKLVRTYLRQVSGREIAVLEAGERAEIQDALDKGRVDLVFMDVRMPGKSGMEWLAEISEKQTAPVVMLTGSGDERIAVQSIQGGAAGYLPKGRLSAENLASTIDEALNRWRQVQQARSDQEKLERLANFDSLTGLYNRRAILGRLEEQTRHAGRYQEEFSLIMADLDHFKEVNDRYGHLAGDDVLESVGRLVQQSIRATDRAGRYGGEEFLIILPRTDLSSGVNVAERIRKAVEAARMEGGKGEVFGITISLGLSSYQAGEETESLISRADDALYSAKKTGRNRVDPQV